MLDSSINPTANWILRLIDEQEEFDTTTRVTVSLPDIVAFIESEGKPLISNLKANISSRFGSQDIKAASSIFDPKKFLELIHHIFKTMVNFQLISCRHTLECRGLLRESMEWSVLRNL